MKFIDAGYQYKVFALENGRVFKKKNSPFFTLYQMFRVYRQHENSEWSAFKKAFVFLKKSKGTTLEIKRRLNQIPTHLFGDPIFRNGIDYEQNRVEPIEKYLDTHTLEENKSLIDKYIQLTYLLWECGIHDAIFKIKANYGVNSRNEVILIDFNEVTFSQQEALETIHHKKWLHSRFYARWEEGELKSYYTIAMNTKITGENFKLHWQKSTTPPSNI